MWGALAGSTGRQRRAPAHLGPGIRHKSSGWLYDPVACVWHLPDDPKKWLDTVRLLVELEEYSPEPFALPL